MKNLAECKNLDICDITLICFNPRDHVPVDIVSDQLQFSCQIPLGKFGSGEDASDSCQSYFCFRWMFLVLAWQDKLLLFLW